MLARYLLLAAVCAFVALGFAIAIAAARSKPRTDEEAGGAAVIALFGFVVAALATWALYGIATHGEAACTLRPSTIVEAAP